MTNISIVIPMYNSAKTINRTLKSITNSLNEDVELILINDGSTDETEDIINEYIKSSKKEISYYSKPNGGLADTRNFGIKKAKRKIHNVCRCR